MTPEEITSEVAKANTGGAVLGLVEAAFKSQRLDLVKACFAVPKSGAGAFVMMLEKEPPSHFKDEVVLLILPEPWFFDEEPGRPSRQGSRGPPRLEAVCIEVLSSRLPDEGLRADGYESIQRLSTLSSRRILAEKFRKILNVLPKAEVVEKTLNPEQEMNLPKESLSTAIPTAAVSTIPHHVPALQSTVGAPQIGDPKSSTSVAAVSSTRNWWPWGIGGVLLLALIGFLFRKSK